MRTSLEPLRANTTCNFCHYFQVLCCRNAAHSCFDSFGEWVVLGSGWCWADGSFWWCLCRETTAELFSFSWLLIHPFVSDKHVWKFGLFLDMSCPIVQHEVMLCFQLLSWVLCLQTEANGIYFAVTDQGWHPIRWFAWLSIFQFHDSLPICASVRQEKAKLLRYHAREIKNRRHIH